MRKIIILGWMAVVMVTGGVGSVFADETGKVAPAPANEIAVIETQFGNIELGFFEDKAPGHVKNFKTLAKTGFYNGTLFHRVIPGFMIQGGDPNSKKPDRSMHGTGGPGYSINAEFNETKHDRGILSMARSQDPNSAGSQFFIVVKDAHFLDGKYTAFGKVTKGMDVADKIVNSPRDARDNPLESISMKITIKSKE
jgi:peptidyl-prolyl cis-trans isomerase B (cyclophilin B)